MLPDIRKNIPLFHGSQVSLANTEVLGYLSYFHFIRHKSDTDWRRIDLGPLLWETDN
jgi:hypothetical protein